MHDISPQNDVPQGARRRRARNGEGTPEAGEARLVINSAVVSALTAVGVVTGFLDTAVMAALFGLSKDTDAFYMAWTIPWVFGPLLTLSAYSALVPAFTQRAELDGERGAWQLLNAIVGIVGGILLVLTLEGIAWTPALMRVLASGFEFDKYRLTVQLTRLLFPIVFLQGMTAIIRSFLYSRRVFTFPTMLTPLSDLTAIGILIALAPRLGVVAAGVGFLAGASLQLIVVLILLARHAGFHLRPSLNLRTVGLSSAFGMYGVMVGGQGLRRLVIFVERFLSSFLVTGSIFALNIGNKVNMMIGGVFFGAMTTVILPDLSAGMVRTELDKVRRDLAAGLRLITLVSLPLAMALLILRVPLVQLLFLRGVVTRPQTLLVASILGFYVLSIPGMGYFRLVQNFYYSAVSGRAASFMFIYAAVANGVLDVVLVRSLGAQGIALAWTISVSLVAVTGLLLLERRVPGMPWMDLLRYAAKVSVVSVSMGVALVGGYRIMGVVIGNLPVHGEVARTLVFAGAVGAGAATFVGLAVLLRVGELQILLGALRRRAGRRVRRRTAPSVAS